MSHRRHVENCLNCGAETPGAFCPACGQEATDASVTLRDQLSDFFAEVLTVEARLPQTVRLLMLSPGALTRAYNSGQRVRYVTPLKTYLFASVVFFVLLAFNTSRAEPHLSHTGKADGLNFVVDAPDSAAPEAGAATDTTEKAPPGGSVDPFASEASFDRWLAEPGKDKSVPPWLEPHLRSLIKSPKGFVAALVDMISKASMVLVPIHALLLKLLYWKPRRLYGEHIVFSLHMHSFVYVLFTLSALVGLLFSTSTGGVRNVVTIVWSMAYSVLAARTAYSETWVRSAVKMAVAGAGYGLAMMGVVMLTAVGVFFMN